MLFIDNDWRTRPISTARNWTLPFKLSCGAPFCAWSESQLSGPICIDVTSMALNSIRFPCWGQITMSHISFTWICISVDWVELTITKLCCPHHLTLVAMMWQWQWVNGTEMWWAAFVSMPMDQLPPSSFDENFQSKLSLVSKWKLEGQAHQFPIVCICTSSHSTAPQCIPVLSHFLAFHPLTPLCDNWTIHCHLLWFLQWHKEGQSGLHLVGQTLVCDVSICLCCVQNCWSNRRCLWFF